MKKLLIGSMGMILSSLLLIKIGLNMLPDCGVYNGQDARAADALAISTLNEEMTFPSSAAEFMEIVHKIIPENVCDVLYVEATNSSNWGFRCSQMTFSVEAVLEGNQELIGKDLPVYILTLGGIGFYEYDADIRQEESKYLDDCGYSSEKYPDLYNKKDAIYGYLNMPVCGHHYIIFVEEVIIDDKIGTLYYTYLEYFDKEDANQDQLLTIEDPILSHYPNNITLFYDQKNLDAYCKIKKELYAYFGLES